MMETIEEYQKRRREEIREAEEASRKAGIICPNCENEMLKGILGILLSSPPQIEIECPKCKYKTNVLA